MPMSLQGKSINYSGRGLNGSSTQALTYGIRVRKRKTKLKWFILLISGGATLLGGYASVYRVDAGRQAVVTQSGRIMGEPRTKPGFYWRIPVVQSVHYLPHRDFRWNGLPVEVSTWDGKSLCVTAAGKWGVGDPIAFFQNVGSTSEAMRHIESVIAPAVRIIICSYRLQRIVSEHSGPKERRRCQPEIIEEIVAVSEPHLSRVGIELKQLEVEIL
jgi:membrane protease subunit HflC